MNLYGLTLVFAIFISYSFTAYRAKKRGLSTQIVWDSLPWVLVFGILGARIYHVLNYWGYYSQNPVWILEVWRGGLGIFGAVAGGLIGLLLYFKRSYPSRHSDLPTNRWRSRRLQAGVSVPKNLNSRDPSLRRAQDDERKDQDDEGKILNYLDVAAPAIILGQALGRVGNVFNSENLPYAWWEIITNLSIFLFLILIERFVNSKKDGSRIKSGMTDVPGNLFVLYLLSYSVSRFFLEFFRTDSPWIWGPLTVAQWVCLGVIVILVVLSMSSRYLKSVDRIKE